jgi:glycosyltransferase involved in cell wall biosynthesis
VRVVLCSSFVPFIYGGARFIVEWTEQMLRESGHEVERVYLPYHEGADEMFAQMTAYRLLDLSEYADRIITFRPPSHVIPHPNKVIWFIHHVRAYYDLWDSPYREVADDARGRVMRRRLFDADTAALSEARHVFTNSRVVADRLRRFNGIEGEVLYPPVFRPERFKNTGYGDEIVCVSRLEHHKRQHLLVDAMRLVKTPVRLRLCGSASDPSYVQRLQAEAERHGLTDRVSVENRWISEEEKASIVGGALAMAYAPFDEDSYGYPTIEGAHARKATLTTTDSGGVTEFVEDGSTGYVAEPTAESLAAAMDEIFSRKERTRAMGEASEHRLTEIGVSWPQAIARLLA